MRSGGNNFNYFPKKVNRPKWQISCNLYVCLCFVWRIGGLGPHPTRATLLGSSQVINSAVVAIKMTTCSAPFYVAHGALFHLVFSFPFQLPVFLCSSILNKSPAIYRLS